jgi:hypothetical protein
MIPNKTEVLNLKTRKTQVPMGYLSLYFKRLLNSNITNIMSCQYYKYMRIKTCLTLGS